jgi:hypothetical protein
VKAPIVEGFSIIGVDREDAQSKLATVDRMRPRGESLIASQVGADTPSVAGSAGCRTPESIFWFVGEPLSRLGKKWLGNPFTTLAGLIPVLAMADVWTIRVGKMGHPLRPIYDLDDPRLV